MAWWNKLAVLFQQPERTPAAQDKAREYTLRHPNVKLLDYESSGKSRFACAYHHEFVDDYDTIKNTHWGCPECNIEKNQQLTPHIPTANVGKRELALAWYWQRRAQSADSKDDMARLCDELERRHYPLKILSYRILPSDKVPQQWVYELTLECALDGIVRAQHPLFDVHHLPEHLCPQCQQRWSGKVGQRVKFPINP